jgi:hypothetical protein
MNPNMTEDSMTGAAPEPAAGRPSGLRNPKGAVRGAGAGALAAEGIMLPLAIQPIRVLGGHLTGLSIVVIVVLALACFVVAGLLRRGWAWHAGSALQVVLFACGFIFHPSLAVLGVLFGLGWSYVLYVRHTVLR